ncbi:hypothetical protein [Planococcus shixiaomingii]|uniref:hypothetical protein n=1 Tax=Planococcus shixiaomingii TaxID=3058393 RepID=UPI00262B209E|nr:hypothetical protein [Planococcus sp. N022]WKA56638.1 hypothetical protein QWY21_09915 [Planococcus sp. N022]
MSFVSQVSQNTETVTKEEITLRTVFNVYGVFAFLGLILSIFTHPISGNENTYIFYDQALMMDSNTMKEFLLFILASSFIYFCLVNIYFLGRLWRKAVFATLILLAIFSLVLIFYSITSPIAH